MLKHILDRPVTVTMILFVVAVLGIVSMHLLPVSLIPDVKIPYITVQVSDQRFSAREMDESIVRPLRQQLMQIDGLEDITAESRDGLGSLKLTFSNGADIDYLFIEANEKIDRAMSVLPQIQRPKVFKASATDIPAFYINITGKKGYNESFLDLSSFASEVISKRIEQLKEVALVDMSGCDSPEILIVPDKQKLAALGLTLDMFESYVKASNVQLGSLSIKDGQYSYNVKFQSYAGSRQDIADIWFKAGDRLLQIKDVASVDERPAPKTGMVLSGEKDAICMAVIKQSDARMSDLKKNIDKTLQQFHNDYPQLSFEITRNQTQLLEYTIRNLIQNIVLGILLACLIIFLFMGDFRSPALVSIVMPASLIFSMLVFYAVGLSLNIISLAGLLLGVGMLTDNTVILVDNITARWNRSGDLRSSVIDGTKEVRGPMLSSVLTTCAVFIPLVFISGIAGALFYDQAMAVTIVLLTSYIVTITIIPVYYWQWYKNQPRFKANAFLQRIDFNKPLQRWDDKYMGWFIRHKRVCWYIIIISIVGTVICFAAMPKEKLPKMTYTDTVLKIDWNSQITVEQNKQRVERLNKLIENKAVQITSLVGEQQFVLGHSGNLSPEDASVYINCKNQKELEEVKNSVTEIFSKDYPSAEFYFEPSGNIFDMVFGEKNAMLLARLRPVSSSRLEDKKIISLIEKLKKELPDIRMDMPAEKTDLVFIADPDLMALYGINYSDLISVLKNALNAGELFDIVQGDRVLPVITGSDSKQLSDVLRDTYISKDGSNIPVSALIKETYATDFKTIVSGAEGNYCPLVLNVSSSAVRKTMSKVQEAVRKDGNFEVSFSGSWFSNRKMAVQMIFILAVALMLLYLILASQFESLVQPLIILSEIIIDVFASLLVLCILGVSINLMSLIGLVVISGIVINDSILKIDTINKLRKGGMGVTRAVMVASSRRMKAIIMTSLTTILAVCPFLSRGNMGADLQYPMSLVIIAGMIVGTLVSLFIIPAIYHSTYFKSEKRNGHSRAA